MQLALSVTTSKIVKNTITKLPYNEKIIDPIIIRLFVDSLCIM